MIIFGLFLPSRWFQKPTRDFLIFLKNEAMPLIFVLNERYDYKLLMLNCTVIVGCRGVEKAAESLNAKKYGDKLVILPLDLMKLSSVKVFADSIKKTGIQIHCLINNAGIFGPLGVTEDGFENHIATNYLGHFLLSHLLFPSLLSAAGNGFLNS